MISPLTLFDQATSPVTDFTDMSASETSPTGCNSEARLPACPFCHLADQLETIAWSDERADGRQYNGDAVRCNRCNAIAPLFTWLSLSTPNPLAGTQPENLTQD